MESLADGIARFKPGDPVTPAVVRSTGSSSWSGRWPHRVGGPSVVPFHRNPP